MKWKTIYFPRVEVMIVFPVLLFLFVGCYTVPETGRTALNVVPDAQLSRLALASFNQLKEEEKVSDDYEMNVRVNRVGKRIARSVGKDLPKADWEFIVFDNDELINAFAMPGGKVGVYSGIFKIATTDSLLAVVMGHEIAHVTARHANQRLSRELLIQFVAFGIDSAMEDSSRESRNAVLTAYGVGTSFGYRLPYSRLSEKEADHLGLIYLARAGYDPVASLEFWRRMEEAETGEKPPQFLSTHPSGENRKDHLLELMPLALDEYEKALQEGKVNYSK